MATRPVFVPAQDESSLVKEVEVEFEWHPGFSTKQKRKSVRSLHSNARRRGLQNVLEISTKSESELGQKLSAFNLLVGRNPDVSVESAYQGSKVFEHGGPYNDLYEKESLEAKKDDRLRSSGDLTAFNLKGQEWPLEPKTAFYDWLYLRALNQYEGRIEKLMHYDGFTDIEFNPDKSVNCQARAAAKGVALQKAGYLEEAIHSKESFIRTLKNGIPEKIDSTGHVEEAPSLFASNGPKSTESENSYISDEIFSSAKEDIGVMEELKSANNKLFQNILVKVLRKIRSKYGLTQEEVGEKMGIARSTVSDFETGKSNPRLGMIIEYVDAVGADLEFIIQTADDCISIESTDFVELDEEKESNQD